jgi:hypothetical protein
MHIAGIQEVMQGRSDDGEKEWRDMTLAMQPRPKLRQFVIHYKYKGKPLKDFKQGDDMIKFMPCENHHSSYVEKAI